MSNIQVGDVLRLNRKDDKVFNLTYTVAYVFPSGHVEFKEITGMWSPDYFDLVFPNKGKYKDE